MHYRPSLGQSAPSASIVTARQTRTYEVASLLADGTRNLNEFRAPAYPLIDRAFSAFAQGALLATPDGPVAIEDLMPGDYLKTTSGEPAQIVWIGSATFVPKPQMPRTRLVRIMADSFGPGRPGSFVTVGPAARILQTPPHLRGYADGEPLLTPATEFIDNVNVISVTPPTPVRLFHLCLSRHAAVDLGGVQMETFHPGNNILRGATHSQRDFFLSMFPKIAHVSDFGPLAHRRAPTEENGEIFAA